MTKDKQPSDPSMEEILASIRRMIANEPKVEETPSFASHKSEGKEEILDLTDLLSEESSAPGKEKRAKLKEEKVMSSPAEKAFDDLLVSSEAASDTAKALGSLAQFAQGRRRIADPASHVIENQLHDILKPLLKEWLDVHLPSLVRWVVNEQVEKIMKQGGVMTPERKADKPKDFF